MLRVFGLLILLSLSNCFECNEEGYDEYLESYEFKANETDTYEVRLNSYTTNCNSLTKMKKTCGFADFTFLMDWSDEELDELGRLGVEYSGNAILYTEEITITQNEMSIEKRSRDFSSLEDYNAPEEKCSTSWATAAIRAAEAALNYKVKLSEEQLFYCLPKDLGFANGCDGVHPKKLMEYLLEEGLVEKNAFDGCDKLDGLKKYRFTPTTADPPTAAGLMNLLANDNKPVFVMMAIDLKKLRFVKDMTNIRDVVKCGGYQPSLYGVLTGYKYADNTDSTETSSIVKSGWWEVVTNVIPGEEIVMKIPMSVNMENGNYAGITAYAFTLSEVIEPTSYVYYCTEKLYPTIEDIPTDATNLTFAANNYNNVTTLDLTRFTQLQELVFEDYTFQRCNNVTINGSKLKVLRIGNHCFQYPESDSRRLASANGLFTIINAGNLEEITIGDNSMGNFDQVVIVDSNPDVNITIGDNSFSADVEINADGNSSSFGEKLEDAIDEANTTPCGEDLVISSEIGCYKLNMKKTWKTIVVNEGLCNSFTNDIDVSDYECLQSIEVKKKSFQNLNSLKISSLI